ncbi:MAG TPA: hypothetical protein VFS99_01700 [Xanthomonadaceae bacterium]|nr:hypothetical protein [Xanthomonadaceae bacterium]
MDRFEYAIGLMSIIVGLGLADLAMSLHRLLKHRMQVKWDGLAVGTAIYAAFTLVRMWYQLWTVRDLTEVTSLFFYLGLILEMFLVFLAAAATLPDESDPVHERWDLRAYYDRHRRYIWGLFVLFQLSYLGHALYFTQAFAGQGIPFAALLRFVLAPLAIYVALVSVRSRRLQAALLGLVFALEAFNSWNDAL